MVVRSSTIIIGVLICNTSSGIAKKNSKIKETNYLTKQSSGMLSAPISLADGASMYADFSDAPYPVLFQNGEWVSNGNKEGKSRHIINTTQEVSQSRLTSHI